MVVKTYVRESYEDGSTSVDGDVSCGQSSTCLFRNLLTKIGQTIARLNRSRYAFEAHARLTLDPLRTVERCGADLAPSAPNTEGNSEAASTTCVINIPHFSGFSASAPCNRILCDIPEPLFLILMCPETEAQSRRRNWDQQQSSGKSTDPEMATHHSWIYQQSFATLFISMRSAKRPRSSTAHHASLSQHAYFHFHRG